MFFDDMIYCDYEEAPLLNLKNINQMEQIKAHSKNIIDLIEEGDYVNGKKVLEKVGNKFCTVSSSNIGDNRILGFMIESIVTKEQFEAIEYKVEN